MNDVVGRQADIEITTRGSDWYFTVCAIMGLTTLLIMGFSFRKAQTERVFHYITAAITATSTIAYFAMGSNLGFNPVPVEFQRSESIVSGTSREVFYARYIQWFITTPLILTELMLTMYRVQDYVVEKWDEVSVSDEFEQGCQEVASGE